MGTVCDSPLRLYYKNHRLCAKEENFTNFLGMIRLRKGINYTSVLANLKETSGKQLKLDRNEIHHHLMYLKLGEATNLFQGD